MDDLKSNKIPGSGILMKKWISAMIAWALLMSGGCSRPLNPSFDQTYLPNTVPGRPQQRIDLSAELEKKHPPKKSFFGGGIKAPAAALTWIGQDTLLVTVLRREKREPDTWLYSFAVKPGTGEVRLLDDAEQEAIRKTIERNASEADSSALAEFGMFVIMLAIVVVSGGRATDSGESSGSSFEGVIENNGYDLTMKAKYGKRFWAFSRRQWRYSVKNNQTGRVFKGHYRPSEDAVEAFESWLKSWRISPDGRYYLIGKTASIIDSESRAAHTAFMSDYSNAGLDVSPSWDQVAILMMKPDERTGRLKCWIEFYPFTSGKQRTS